MLTPDDASDCLLEYMDMASLAAISSNDIDSIYETLQEPFEDMERRILVSSLVQDAVSRGFLKALEEDLHTQLASRDGIIRCLEGKLREKDTEISDYVKILGTKKDDVFFTEGLSSNENVEKEFMWQVCQDILMNYVQEITHAQFESAIDENVTRYLIELEWKAETESMITQVLLECWSQQVVKLIGNQETHHSRKLEIEETFVSERFQYDLVLDIVSEILLQKFQEALLVGDSRSKVCTRNASAEKTMYNNFGALEAQIESLLEFEASKLEMIKYGCSTSIAKCEFKLETLMENLANQVSEMRSKISFVQEAIKQQEWKHMVEQDILISLLWDKMSEINNRITLLNNSKEIKDAPTRVFDIPPDSKDTIETEKVIASIDNIELKSSGTNLESLSLMQDNKKLIFVLKNSLDDIRKEKAAVEQKLEERTEELYSLKRQFWKEREFWVSKLSPPLIKEFEAQVEDLSKHSSVILDLEEEYKNLERIRYDSIISELRKEWSLEKESLLLRITEKEAEIENMHAELMIFTELRKEWFLERESLVSCITEREAEITSLHAQLMNLREKDKLSRTTTAEFRKEWSLERESLLLRITEKEAEIENMNAQLMTLTEKDKSSTSTTASLFACVTDLNAQVDKLSAENLKKDIDLIKCEQEWYDEKKSMEVERDRLLTKEQNYLTREQLLLGQISELQKELKSIQSIVVDQQSVVKEWEIERQNLLRKVSDGEDMISRIASREEANKKRIEQLETERDHMKEIQDQNKTFINSLMEEREAAQTLLIKERDDEKQIRKKLESELQKLKHELESLHKQNADRSDPKFLFDLGSNFEEQIDQSPKALYEFQQRIVHMMGEKSERLECVDKICQLVKSYVKPLTCKEAYYRQKLAKELYNLQKAETEVDLLGDEVESLLLILEEVQTTFELYAPILQHYPKMSQVADLVKREVQLRIDPKYGT